MLPTHPRPIARARFVLTALFAGLLGVTGLTVCAQSPKDSGNSALKPETREGWWMKMHESFLERAKAGKVDLLFLGDSITQGWANESKEGPAPVWQRHYGARNAANFGIGGDRTQHVLWRLEHGEVDGISPKVAVVMIGTNNMGSNTPAEIAEGVTAVVKTLRAKLPKTKVLLLGVFPRGPKSDSVRERVKAVNERIAGLDDGGKTVKYLDIGPKFLESDGTLSREVMPDLIHLSRQGYRVWADAIEPTVWSMLEGG